MKILNKLAQFKQWIIRIVELNPAKRDSFFCFFMLFLRKNIQFIV